ncbi:MAG: hypothetical protein IH936_13420 [Acidobacteria bacterium]|nr:hypothetical protein [Acidobacteriota bacterium]
MLSFLQTNWFNLITAVAATLAVILAWRAGQTAGEANEVASKANVLASKANDLAQRGIRVSKLPSVEALYRRFRKLAVGLEDADRETLQELNSLAQDVRLVSRDHLHPPIWQTYSVAARIWRDRESKQPQHAPERTEWANKLTDARNQARQAFEDFINE